MNDYAFSPRSRRRREFPASDEPALGCLLPFIHHHEWLSESRPQATPRFGGNETSEESAVSGPSRSAIPDAWLGDRLGSGGAAPRNCGTPEPRTHADCFLGSNARLPCAQAGRRAAPRSRASRYFPLRSSAMMASSAAMTSVRSTSLRLNWRRRLKVFVGGRYWKTKALGRPGLRLRDGLARLLARWAARGGPPASVARSGRSFSEASAA